jgi:hypothetical protein
VSDERSRARDRARTRAIVGGAFLEAFGLLVGIALMLSGLTGEGPLGMAFAVGVVIVAFSMLAFVLWVIRVRQLFPPS